MQSYRPIPVSVQDAGRESPSSCTNELFFFENTTSRKIQRTEEGYAQGFCGVPAGNSMICAVVSPIIRLKLMERAPPNTRVLLQLQLVGDGAFFFSLDIMRSSCNGTAIFQLSRRWLHTFERNASVKRQLNSLAVSYTYISESPCWSVTSAQSFASNMQMQGTQNSENSASSEEPHVQQCERACSPSISNLDWILYNTNRWTYNLDWLITT